MVGSVPVGGDSPITVQTMTNTLTADAAATIAQIRLSEEAGVDIVRVSCPDEESDGRPGGHRQGVQGADRGRHPFPLPARHRGGRGGRGLPAHQSRQYRQCRSGARGREGRQGPWLLHAHRRQCRLAGEGPAREIRRALSRGDGRERARSCAHPPGPRLPRIQDQREGVGRLPRRRRLPAAGRCLRLSPAYRRHRGRRPAHRDGEVVDRPGGAAVGRHRRYHSRPRCRPSLPRK